MAKQARGQSGARLLSAGSGALGPTLEAPEPTGVRLKEADDRPGDVVAARPAQCRQEAGHQPVEGLGSTSRLACGFGARLRVGRKADGGQALNGVVYFFPNVEQLASKRGQEAPEGRPSLIIGIPVAPGDRRQWQAADVVAPPRAEVDDTEALDERQLGLGGHAFQ